MVPLHTMRLVSKPCRPHFHTKPGHLAMTTKQGAQRQGVEIILMNDISVCSARGMLKKLPIETSPELLRLTWNHQS